MRPACGSLPAAYSNVSACALHGQNATECLDLVSACYSSALNTTLSACQPGAEAAFYPGAHRRVHTTTCTVASSRSRPCPQTAWAALLAGTDDFGHWTAYNLFPRAYNGHHSPPWIVKYNGYVSDPPVWLSSPSLAHCLGLSHPSNPTLCNTNGGYIRVRLA